MTIQCKMLLAAVLLITIHAHAAGGAPGNVAGAAPYAVQGRFILGGPGGWDYLTVDSAAKRLYISRSDRVLVLNTSDGSLVATIPDTAGVHGIALAPDLVKGFTSNGRADTVSVFDLSSLKITKTIPAGGHNPDAILYDKASKHLYTFNGRSLDVSVIDPIEGTLLATIPAGGKPEFAVADGRGRVFVNIEDTSELLAIDSRAAKRLATWPLPHCDNPTGLALDAVHDRLFSVCSNGAMVVTDALSGRHIAEVPIGRGPDAATFDGERGLVFSSNGQDGTLSVIHQEDPDHYRAVATVSTQKSARTMALDAANHRVYLVAAQFGAAPAPSADQPHPRPPVIEGSFNVLVVGN